MWFEDVAALVGNVRRYSCCICWVVELGKWLKRWRLFCIRKAQVCYLVPSRLPNRGPGVAPKYRQGALQIKPKQSHKERTPIQRTI